MTTALLILIAADYVYGAQPPIKPCDQLAYLPMAIPDAPMPSPKPLPNSGAQAYADRWAKHQAEIMRRRGQ